MAKKWKWLGAYMHLIYGVRTSSDVEDCMNDHETLVQVNAPRAMNVVAVKSKVSLLEQLKKDGKLL